MAKKLTVDVLLKGYASGVFPMAESRDDPEIFWVNPQWRGILPLEGFHISRSLARRIRSCPYDIRINSDFAATVRGCADREETWINDEIFALYEELHRRGFAHSLEVWEGDALVGGVYGVTLGAAFFGESMFSRRRDASKIALAYLVDWLRQSGFMLFDTQFVTGHLVSLGAEEIPRDAYRERLAAALLVEVDFYSAGAIGSASEVLQRNAQTS